jgi:hypothetical protein
MTPVRPDPIWLARRMRGDLVNRPACDRDAARFPAQPRSRAFRTRLRVQVSRKLFAYDDGIGLSIAALQIGQDTFEGVFTYVLVALFASIMKTDPLLAGAMQNRLLDVFRKLGVWLLQIEAIVVRQGLQHLKIELVAPVPSLDRT